MYCCTVDAFTPRGQQRQRQRQRQQLENNYLQTIVHKTCQTKLDQVGWSLLSSTSLQQQQSSSTSSSSSQATHTPKTTVNGNAPIPLDESDSLCESRTNGNVEKTVSFSSNQPSSDHQLTLVVNKNNYKHLIARFLAHPIVEVTDFILVLVSSLLVAISTLNERYLSNAVWMGLQIAQDGIAMVFVIEFFMRWIASTIAVPEIANGTLRVVPKRPYLTQPIVLVDVLVVLLPFLLSIAPPAFRDYLPSFFTSSSALINLRLLRILRLQRVLQDATTFQNFERALGMTDVKPWQLQLARVVLSVFTLLSVATGLIYTTEHAVNPNLDNYFSAFYFGLTTLTTVGFGDVTPVTWQGKLVVSGSILAGVAVIPAQGAALVDALWSRQEEEKKKTESSLVEDMSSYEMNENAGRLVMETVQCCSSCQAAMHWSHARYCWSCGSPLENGSTQQAKIDRN